MQKGRFRPYTLPSEQAVRRPRAPPAGLRAAWTAGRTVAVVAGAVLVLCSLGLLGAGGATVMDDVVNDNEDDTGEGNQGAQST